MEFLEEPQTDDTDWTVIRSRYEMQGASFAELERSFGVSLERIKYRADSEGWQRKAPTEVVKQLQTTNPDTEVLEALKTLLDDKIQLAEILKHEALLPKYHMLETAVLNKAITIVSMINPDLPSAGLQLSQAMKGIQRLYQIGGMVKEGGKAEANEDNRMVININNRIK